jgi:hypothetical protein
MTQDIARLSKRCGMLTDQTTGRISSVDKSLPAGAPPNAVVGQPKFKLGDTAIYMRG